MEAQSSSNADSMVDNIIKIAESVGIDLSDYRIIMESSSPLDLSIKIIRPRLEDDFFGRGKLILCTSLREDIEIEF